jgi:hypothetical protein
MLLIFHQLLNFVCVCVRVLMYEVFAGFLNIAHFRTISLSTSSGVSTFNNTFYHTMQTSISHNDAQGGYYQK